MTEEPISRGGPPPPIAAGTPPAPVRLVDLFADLFLLAASLQTSDPGDSAQVRAHILDLLGRASVRGKDAGYEPGLVDEARFAVVALLDELILSSTWPGREAWRGNPLQRELFRLNTAGEEFFIRLEKIRAARAENRPLLEVYQVCLALGFEGRFKLLGPEKLELLRRELAGDLGSARTSMDGLAPHWQPPDQAPETVGEGVPVWLTLAGVLGGALILIVVFALAAGASAGRTADVVSRLYARISG
jgi:type VI secretion system protein ImpK